MMKKFMNPLVDAGFKRIFGRKMYMREFLNDLLMLEHPIKSVTFLDKEMVPASERDHGVGVRPLLHLSAQLSFGK